jgi:hypothetical protein
MSTNPPQPDPEVVVIKEMKNDGNVWMWTIFVILFIAIILVVAGMCMSNKRHKQMFYNMPSSSTSVPPSVGSSFQGGGRSSAMSTAPVTHSMFNSSASPMSFLSY